MYYGWGLKGIIRALLGFWIQSPYLLREKLLSHTYIQSLDLECGKEFLACRNFVIVGYKLPTSYAQHQESR